MPFQIPRFRKEGICRACGDKFERKARNQVLCPGCGYWTMYQGNIKQFITLAEPKLKQAADESGNPKIWRRGDPVDMLPEGMRQRVETAMRLGV